MKTIIKKRIHLLVIIAFMLFINIFTINTVKAYTVPSADQVNGVRSISFRNDKAERGEKVYLNITYAPGVVRSEVSLKINLNSSTYLLGVYDVNTDNPYFILTQGATIGKKYEMTSVIFKDQKGTITFSTNSNLSYQNYYINCGGKNQITVLDYAVNPADVSVKEFSFNSTKSSFSLWETVPVKIKTNGKIAQAALIFYNDKLKKTITAQVRDIDTANPYVSLNGEYAMGYEKGADVNRRILFKNCKGYG